MEIIFSLHDKTLRHCFIAFLIFCITIILTFSECPSNKFGGKLYTRLPLQAQELVIATQGNVQVVAQAGPATHVKVSVITTC